MAGKRVDFIGKSSFGSSGCYRRGPCAGKPPNAIWTSGGTTLGAWGAYKGGKWGAEKNRESSRRCLGVGNEGYNPGLLGDVSGTRDLGTRGGLWRQVTLKSERTRGHSEPRVCGMGGPDIEGIKQECAHPASRSEQRRAGGRRRICRRRWASGKDHPDLKCPRESSRRSARFRLVPVGITYSVRCGGCWLPCAIPGNGGMARCPILYTKGIVYSWG